MHSGGPCIRPEYGEGAAKHSPYAHPHAGCPDEVARAGGGARASPRLTPVSPGDAGAGGGIGVGSVGVVEAEPPWRSRVLASGVEVGNGQAVAAPAPPEQGDVGAPAVPLVGVAVALGDDLAVVDGEQHAVAVAELVAVGVPHEYVPLGAVDGAALGGCGLSAVPRSRGGPSVGEVQGGGVAQPAIEAFANGGDVGTAGIEAVDAGLVDAHAWHLPSSRAGHFWSGSRM